MALAALPVFVCKTAIPAPAPGARADVVLVIRVRPGYFADLIHRGDRRLSVVISQNPKLNPNGALVQSSNSPCLHVI